MGIAGCFFLNGLSFMAVIAGYLAMRLPQRPMTDTSQTIREATSEAVRFVAGHRSLRAVVALVAIVSLFGWPYSVLMPVFAKDILHVGATGYGLLMAANGIGALAGALSLAILGDGANRRKLIFTGVFGFSAMTFVFALSTSVWLSGCALACAGWFMIVFFASANTSVQLRSPDALRGRIMGIYALAFIGLSPVGSLMAGAAARASSAPVAIAGGAVICALAAFVTMRVVPAQASAAPQ